MSKGRFAEDLTGRRYGNLEVIQKLPSKHYPNGRTVAMFLCCCDCGKEIAITAARLRSGGVTSCGCMQTRNSDIHNLDLTDQRFGRWTALYKVTLQSSSGSVDAWHCRCDCGNESDVRTSSLFYGGSKSCGCLKKDVLTVFRDLTGQQFGRWTVLRQSEPYVSPKGRVVRRWACRCSCGTERDVAETALLSGKSVSCGCYRLDRLREEQYHDLTGQQFGELTAIRRLEDRRTANGNRIQEWLCKCSCGKYVIRARTGLASGTSTSCGHNLPNWTLEANVEKYLSDRGFVYKRQYRDSALVGVGGLPLSFDFALYRDNDVWCLVECQGKQHYEPVERFGGLEEFEKQKIHDKRKAAYAKNHGYLFVEIPYYYDTYDAVEECLNNVLSEN